jgi:hypothetical protein
MGVITERERQKYFAYLDGVADGLNESRDDGCGYEFGDDACQECEHYRECERWGESE